MTRRGHNAGVTTFEDRLAGETNDWVREGLVSAEQAGAIRRRYDGQEGDRRWSRVVQVLAIGGAVAVGLGVILFFAANWSELPQFTRLALIVAAMVASYAAGDRLRPTHPHVGHALLLLGCL